MTHGFSATVNRDDRGQVRGEAFSEAGFAVLLYDHRGLGDERRRAPAADQQNGFKRGAIATRMTFPRRATGPRRVPRRALGRQHERSRGQLVVGAIDPRVKAVIAQVPACGDNPPPSDADGSLFAATREKLLNGDVSGPRPSRTPSDRCPWSRATREGVPVAPRVAHGRTAGPSSTGSRFGSRWENSATLVAPATPSAALCAAHLEAPLCMILSPEDEMAGCNPAVARLAFAAARGPKELTEVAGGHFGLLYHPSPLFDQASRAQREFLDPAPRRKGLVTTRPSEGARPERGLARSEALH